MLKVCETCRCAYEAEHQRRKYCSLACVPKEVYRRGQRNGRVRLAKQQRAAKFRAMLKQLPQRCTQDDICALLQIAYYNGVRAEYMRWIRKTSPMAKAS